MSSTHRLAAILFTDIVGYSAVMQQDKSKAMEMAQRHEEVVNLTVAKYHGEVVNFYGDGSLSLLETASCKSSNVSGLNVRKFKLDIFG